MSHIQKYIKDFNSWNVQKQNIDKKWLHKKVRPGEVWWSTIGVNIGNEQDGGHNFKRPVIILKRINYMLALVVPLTSQVKNPKSPFYFILQSDDKKSVCILPQMRVISTKRLIRAKWALPADEFTKLMHSVAKFFFSEYL